MRRSWIAAATLGALGLVACDAIFGDTKQCSTDGDCAGIGGLCGADGFCLPRRGEGAPPGSSNGTSSGGPVAEAGSPTGPSDAGSSDAGSSEAGPIEAGMMTVQMGETTLLTVDDNGNGGLTLAQQATLAQAATLKTLTFYVDVAAGKLRLGLYDATGPNGGPGALKAETAEVVAVAGWMAVPVQTPVLLPAGNYWLAYAPELNGLGFHKAGDGTGKLAYYTRAYGPLPATFSTTPTTENEHWSFYATLTR